MNKKVNNIIQRLNLSPHPEGGYYKEIYRSEKNMLINGSDQSRSLSTSIYYLLLSGQVSLFHVLKSDEIWYHHVGCAIILHCLHPAKGYSTFNLGTNFENGERPQVIIPAGIIFGAEVITPDSFVLAGCMVSPGFDFRDFDILHRSELLIMFPEQKEIITKLTKL